MTTATAKLSWQDIQRHVMAQIRSGTWKPGDPIPNEADLALELGCARTTVNRALRELAAEGLLERKRKAGTRVAKYPTRRARLHIPMIREEVSALGHAYEYRRLAFNAQPAPENLPPPLEACRGVIYVEALHLADGAPFVFEARWINTAAVPASDHGEFRVTSANEWLVQNAPFTEGQLDFHAIGAPPGIAARLQCAPGAAVFRAERLTRAGAQPVTYVELSYAPGYRKSVQI